MLEDINNINKNLFNLFDFLIKDCINVKKFYKMTKETNTDMNVTDLLTQLTKPNNDNSGDDNHGKMAIAGSADKKT